MKKALIFSVALFATIISVCAQVSGNATYNDNNRFKNSSMYKSKREAPVAASMGNNGYNNNYDNNYRNDDKELMQQITNNYSSYQSGNDFVVKVNVLYNAIPNNYTAIFHLNQAGKKIQELDSLLQGRVNKFMALANKIGVKKDNFYLDMIALVPIFEREKKTFSKSYIQVPKGFEIQKNLHVRYHDPAQLDQLFSMAAQCEIYDLVKVEYQFDSTEIANAIMRDKAQSVLQKKLKYYSKLGIQLDTAFRTVVERQNQNFPVDQYMSYNPLAVSTLDDDASSDASKMAMPTNNSRSTLFYNQISTDGFDIVINPSPLKPGIQLIYSLEMKYRITPTVYHHTKTQKETEMLLITPQGTIKELRK